MLKFFEDAIRGGLSFIANRLCETESTKKASPTRFRHGQNGAMGIAIFINGWAKVGKIGQNSQTSSRSRRFHSQIKIKPLCDWETKWHFYVSEYRRSSNSLLFETALFESILA